MTDLQISIAVEALLVSRNLRQMQHARAALQPGYCLRAARILQGCQDSVIIATGFPVADTFETDGPPGAIALYQALSGLGCRPLIACAAPLADLLATDYDVLRLEAKSLPQAREEASAKLEKLRPQAVVSIERPGLAADGRYYNMRGEDISPGCGIFDPYMEQATCPTIAIGDGGNEIGMGKIAAAINELDIATASTSCDELLVADVSNWGAYGLLALLGRCTGRDLLADVDSLAMLEYLSSRGSVDGVTRDNTLSEDGLAAAEGIALIGELRRLTGFGNEPAISRETV